MPTSAAPPSGHQPPPEKRSRATYEEEESKDDNASDESISRDRRGGAVEGDQRPFVSGRTSRRHVGNNTDDDDNYADYDDDADADELSVVTIKSTDGDDAVVMEDDVNNFSSLDRRHYRNMEYDKDARHFVYSKEGTDVDAQEGIPSVDEYMKRYPRDMKEVRVTFGLARKVMIVLLKEEYDAFHARCDELNIPKTSEGLYQHLFGEGSRLVTTIKRDLKLDLPDIYEFLATFYFAAEFRVPPKRLQEHSKVDYDGYMDQGQLNDIWRAIADAGKNGERPAYFWQDLETALNEDCRELFLTFGDRRYAVRVAWDDDKAHLQFSTRDVRADPHFLCGLLPFQHTKANCRGFSINSAIAVPSGFPLGFRASRQGESEQQCYETMLRFMFGYLFSVSGAAHLALNGIIFCSDRGYWTSALILLILKYGGTVFGTLKRHVWVPFTYNQKRRDKREQIETNKGRSIFVSFARWGLYMLKIMAWRGGTGNVSLAMNSDCSEDELVTMEFKFRNSADAKWYHDKDLTLDQRKLKAFRPIDGIEISKEDMDKIDGHIQHSLDVVMLTCSEGLIWFILRMFAVTSSSAVASIKRAAPHIPPTAPNRPAFVNVLDYAGLSNHLGSLNRTSASNISSDEDDEDEEDGLTIDATLVMKIVKLMRRPTQNTANECADFAAQIKDALQKGSLEDATMQAMLVALGINRDRVGTMPNNKMKASLRQWIASIENVRSVPDVGNSSDDESQASTCPSNVITYNFPYDKLLNAKEIEAMLLSRAGSALRKGELPGNIQHPTKKDQRIVVLQTIDNDSSFQPTRNSSDVDHDPLRDAILTGIVSKAFLRPQEGKEKSAAKLGHQNEEKYIKRYYHDSKEGKVPGVKLLHIQRCGMAMHVNKRYARSSADAIGFEFKDDDDYEVIDDDDDIDYLAFDPIKSHLVECKSRSGAGYEGSLRQAIYIRGVVARRLGHDAQVAIAKGDPIYLEVSSSQRDLIAQLIPTNSERIQILHHAFTYGRNKTAFLVGDPHGNILFGLIVTFEPDLLRDYGLFLDYLYEKGLNLFYGETIDDVPLDLIQDILMSDANLRRKYTLDDFMTQLLIWRECLPDSPSNVLHPIPECSMNVPLDYAQWNSSKGGSDTVTRFIWNCLPVLPIKKPQPVIVARYLMNYAVLLHRTIQSVGGTKKPDVDRDTIESVRQRNNQRQPFHNTLSWLHNRLRRSAEEARERNSGSSSTTPRENSTNGETFLQEEAPRYNRRQPDAARVEKNHEILGKAGVTGLTPLGRGKSKAATIRHENYGDIINRNNACVGCSVRLYDDSKVAKNKKVGYKTMALVCDLCGTRGVSTFCTGCNRVLCYDVDRSKQLDERLRGGDGDRLRREFPALDKLSRGNVPAFYCQVGQVNGRNFTVGRSCYHIAHPHLFSPHTQKTPADDVEMEDANVGEDDNITRIANASHPTLHL